MRAALMAATLAVVAAASLLNLVLGGAWVLAVLAILQARRAVRPAAWLVLVASLAAGIAAWRGGLLVPPGPASYAADEWAWLRSVAGRGAKEAPEPPPDVPSAASLRARLVAQRARELGVSPVEVAARAGTLVAASRTLDGLRRRAPAEVAAVEASVARLAFTLTAPEFRDLEARRQRLATYFAALEARLAVARDDGDLDGVAQGLAPAALAPVSLRPVLDDLEAVYAAVGALVRAVSGSVTVEARRRAQFAETGGGLVLEDRYAFAAAGPLRITRVDLASLRAATSGGVAGQVLEWRAEGAGPPEPVASVTVTPPAGVRRLVIVDRRVREVAPAPVRVPLRPIAFGRLAIGPPPPRSGPYVVTVAPAGPGAARAILSLPVPRPRLEGVELPRGALYHADHPGTTVPDGDRDRWTPADAEAAGSGVRLDLTPPSALLRSDAFGRLAPFLFRPNLGAALGIVATAAWAVVLIGRRAPPPPAGPTGGR